MIINVFTDFVINIFTNIFENKISNVINFNRLRDQLKDYIESQEKYNYNVSIEEEIDFQGLADYISNDLIEDFISRLTSVDPKVRSEARERIVFKSVNYSNAKKPLSIDRTKKLVYDAIDIITSFARKNISYDLRILLSEVQETIEYDGEKTRALIKDIAKSNENNLSIDKSIRYLKNNGIRNVEDEITTYLNAISCVHPLYPSFGVEYVNGKLQSKPLSKESTKKYPESIKIFSDSVELDGKNVSNINKSILDYSYRHQIPFVINVETAKHYFGQYEDNFYSIADEISGKKIILSPPSFPKAFPTYIMINDEIVVPYALLRTKKIFDDGSILIDNREQENTIFDIKIKFNIKDSTIDFTSLVNNKSCRDLLEYKQLLLKICSGGILTIVLSETNQVLAKGSLNYIQRDDLIAEIEFLKKIVKIEDYFNINFEIPEEITVDDHKIINRLCKLIDGNHCGNWTKYECKFIISDDFKYKFERHENIGQEFSFVSE